MNCFLYGRDLPHERVKCLPIRERVKQFWRHHIYKYQNIKSALVFTIVFGIYFFTAFPIRVLIFRSIDFFIFTKKTLRARRIGSVSKVLRTWAGPIGIGHAIFKCSRSNSHKQTYNAGPFIAKWRKIMPFRADVTRTNKVVTFLKKDIVKNSSPKKVNAIEGSVFWKSSRSKKAALQKK